LTIFLSIRNPVVIEMQYMQKNGYVYHPGSLLDKQAYQRDRKAETVESKKEGSWWQSNSVGTD
jgi:hypothetical protein